MAKPPKHKLEQRVIIGAREYGIGGVLFRHAIGEKLGVNVTDMECLGVLFFKGVSTPTELSRYTGLTSGATTTMLGRLERAGLITRRPNPDDRRGVLISPNPASVKTVGPLFAGARDAQNALVASYSAAELELISDFFARATAIWEVERTKLQG